MDRNHLKIGADPFPPYQYYDSNGILQGMDYERIKTAGIDAGFEIEFFVDDWTIIEQKFSQGDLDAIFQLPKTPEREKKYLFSKKLRDGVTEIVTGDSTVNISSIKDIEAKKYTIGVVDGISYGEEVNVLDPKCKIIYNDNEKLLSDIGKQKVNFGIFDQGVKQFIMGKLTIKNIYVINALTFTRQLFMAFHNERKRDIFDKHL
jgi:ABC-type amino acid transport substrate-binding protein